MKEPFLSFMYTQTLYQWLHTLKQDGRTIDENIDDFYQLVAWNDLLETKEYLVVRHLSELQWFIQDMLFL